MIHSISPETSIDTFQSCHLSPVILCFSAIQKAVLNLEEISDDGYRIRSTHCRQFSVSPPCITLSVTNRVQILSRVFSNAKRDVSTYFEILSFLSEIFQIGFSIAFAGSGNLNIKLPFGIDLKIAKIVLALTDLPFEIFKETCLRT